MIVTLQIISSVALLLWGLRMVRTGIMRSYGAILRRWAKNSEGQIISPFLSGVLVAIALQSSMATVMIAATFTAQNVISSATALFIMLGADVGTALAVLIVSQKIILVSPIFIIIGVFGFLSTKDNKKRGVSRAFIGIGLILLSLSMIRETAGIFTSNPDFTDIIAILADYTFIILILGIIITYITHSSLAIVLLTASLVIAGTLNIIVAFHLVLGANVASGILPVIANWKANKNARIPTTANLIIRILGVTLAYIFANNIINLFNPIINNSFIPIALHITLNVVVALVGLCTAKQFLKLANKILHDDVSNENFIEPKYLDSSSLSSPSHALANAKRESLVMAEITRDMLAGVYIVLKNDDAIKQKEIIETDDTVDRLFTAIKLYVAQILQRELSQENTAKAMDLLNFTANIEHIGDVIDTGLMALAGKKIKHQLKFSDDGWNEIETLLESIITNFDLTITMFISDDIDLARQLYSSKSDIRDMERYSIETHYTRLARGHTDTIATSSLHLDALRDLKRINSHLTAIAYPILLAEDDDAENKPK